MLGYKGVSTPKQWRALSAVLTRALTDSDLTTRDDLLVQIVDGKSAEKLPIAWHVPATSDIVLNAVKIKGMQDLKKLTESRLSSLARTWLLSESYALAGRYSGDDKLRDDPDSTFARIRGVLAHEAAHSKWSHYLLEDWWQECDPELAQIITQLDEVRIESKQINHDMYLRESLRLSASMILMEPKDVEELRSLEGMVNVPKLALDSVLSLGRCDQSILLWYEVREIWWLVEDVVGFDRVQKMREIWNAFCDIEVANEKEMTALAQEWLDLFPEEEDLDLPGLLDMLKELFGALPVLVEKWASNDDHTHAPDEMADAETEALEVFAIEEGKTDKDGVEIDDDKTKSHGYSKSKSHRFTHRDPTDEEQAMATALARRLEKLSVRARSDKKVRSIMPPGRLNTRAAVAQSADRAQGRASAAQPWARHRRKHTDTPKLKVGFAGDVSGSMGWSTEFLGSLGWIITRAVRHVNGTSAGVVFGGRAEPTYGPADRMDKVIVRDAADGSEAFNSGIAALDGVLDLSGPNDARVLFVVSDGQFVADGEPEACKKWCDHLIARGVKIIWISDEASGGYYGGPPENVHLVMIEPYSTKLDAEFITQMADEVAKAFAR